MLLAVCEIGLQFGVLIGEVLVYFDYLTTLSPDLLQILCLVRNISFYFFLIGH
jgi:hypothetical protein